MMLSSSAMHFFTLSARACFSSGVVAGVENAGVSALLMRSFCAVKNGAIGIDSVCGGCWEGVREWCHLACCRLGDAELHGWGA